MINKMRNALAIIPARGGSKRIPRKNIRQFCGLPIVAYSIKAAQDAGCFQDIMVSTDEPEIADIAKRYGATVPFMRSTQNSSDVSSTADVLLEVLYDYQQRGMHYDFCCCIYPTAPLLAFGRLREAYDLLLSSTVDSVFPIIRFSYPVWRGLKIEDGKAKMIWPEHYGARSQDLLPVFHDAGQFYFFRSESFVAQRKLFMANSVGVEIPLIEGQDIDTEEDWSMAEAKFQILKSQARYRFGHECCLSLEGRVNYAHRTEALVDKLELYPACEGAAR